MIIARNCPAEPVIPIHIMTFDSETLVSERDYQIEARHDPEQVQGLVGVRLSTQEEMFAWRGDEVVLLAHWTPGGFILARGWAYDDRLVDIRRWSYPAPAALAGQIRRLTREATGNHRIAAEAATAALTWAHAIPDAGASSEAT